MGLKETLSTIQSLANKYLIDKPYIVGGLPRDIYMKIPDVKTTDIDITTNSSEVLRLGILLADELNVTFELSDDGHLTVFSDEFDVDFSSHFVSEKVVGYLNGEYQGLEEAFSRDFTINTLHQDLITEEILDPTGQGFEDIKNRLIRTPVPAEITLTDDPRRVYRAINLAARYNFEIDPDIKNFVISNPKMFSAENIKDKYISVKIDKALKTNEDLTIKLLKEMKLFDDVPLAGDFKDILIRKKILVDYLKNNAIDTKFASFLAKNWEEYISQGPEYEELKNWWEQNFHKVPGNFNESYLSWSKWYMDHYRTDWKFDHKNPDEVLEILNSEISVPSFEDRKTRVQEIYNILGTPESFKQQEIAPVKTLPENIKVKPGVNIENVTFDVKDFIAILGRTAQELGVETPVITSGWRSIDEQVDLMGKNWFENGGIQGGRRYLTKLYGQDFGGKMASIFEKYGLGPQAKELGIQVVKSRPIGSSHILSPARAIDLRITPGIKKVLNKIESEGIFDMKIVNETKTAGPHYHVMINGKKNKRANIAKRKAELKKLSA